MELLSFTLIILVLGGVPIFLFSYFVWNIILKDQNLKEILIFRKRMVIFAFSSSLIVPIFFLGENEPVKTISQLLIFLITMFGSAFLGLQLRLIKRQDYKK